MVPFLMKFRWINHIGKDADMLFNVPVGIQFGVLVYYGPLIAALFLPIITHVDWKVPWTARGRELAEGLVI